MAKAADMVNEYIQENPEESMKILSTIVPNIGIGQIFMSKEDSDDEEVEDVEDMDARDLTRAEKAKEMKRRFKEGTGDKREIGKKGYEEVIQPGESDRELDDAEDRYEGGVEEVSKPKFDYKKFFRKRRADGGAIGIEVLFEEKKPRKNFFMGGPALEGQALAIYNSMKAYDFTDQEIANALQGQGYYDPNASTPDSGQGEIQSGQGGNEGQGGIMNLDPYSNTTSSRNQTNNNSPLPQQLLSLDEKKGNPAFMSTVPNPEDYPYSGPVQQFSQIGENLYDVNPEGTITGQRTYKTPRTIGDQVYAAAAKGQLGTGVEKEKGFIGSAIDKFYNLPGIKQGKGLINTIMDNTLVGRLAAMRNPLNPKASNYNPSLQGQIDFLEGATGSRITGTSGNLKTTEGLAMIGRDPNTGLAKYGPGSVLAGKNVISGFGSNDYETALNKYLSRMLRYENPTKFQQAKIQQARDELAALQAKKEQEYIDSGTQAEVKALQKEIDSGKYSGGSDFAQSNQAAVGGGAKGKAANTDNSKSTGTSQGYSQHYARGGLATMFKEKR